MFSNYETFRQHLYESAVTLVPDRDARTGRLGGALIGLAPGVASLLTLWPDENGPRLGGGIAEAFSHPLQTIRQDFGTTRLDFSPSSKDALSSAYTVDDSVATTPTANPLSLVAASLRDQVWGVQLQHVFSATVLDTARIGFSRGSYFFTGQTPVDLPGWITGLPIGAAVVGGGTASNGTSVISLAGTNSSSNLRAVRNLFTYGRSGGDLSRCSPAGSWCLARAIAGQRQPRPKSVWAGLVRQPDLVTRRRRVHVLRRAEPDTARLAVAGNRRPCPGRHQLRPNLDFRIGFRFESTGGWNEAHWRASNYVFANGVIQTNPMVANSVLTGRTGISIRKRSSSRRPAPMAMPAATY